MANGSATSDVAAAFAAHHQKTGATTMSWADYKAVSPWVAAVDTFQCTGCQQHERFCTGHCCTRCHSKKHLCGCGKNYSSCDCIHILSWRQLDGTDLTRQHKGRADTRPQTMKTTASPPVV